jgi:hypothetical protein
LDDLAPAGKGLWVALKVYLDRGAKLDTSDPVVCVAATVFNPSDYVRFTEPWNEMLAGWGAPAFHATDFYCGAPPFARNTAERKSRFDDDCRRIPTLIGHHLLCGIAASFRPDEYVREAPPGWIELFDLYGLGLHALAVQCAMIGVGNWAQEVGYPDGFAYYMEAGDDDEAQVSAMVARLRRNETVGPHIRADSFTTIKKNQARGIDVSDWLAWHSNKFFSDKYLKGLTDVHHLRKDFRAFLENARGTVIDLFLTGEPLRGMFELGTRHLISEFATWPGAREFGRLSGVFGEIARDGDQQ